MANWGRILSRGSVDDRRALGPTGIGGLGVGGIVIVLLLNYALTGQVDLSGTLNQLQNAQVQQNSNFNTAVFDGQDSYEVFTSTVLGSTNDMWSKLFAEQNLTYFEPSLVLFRGSTESRCGGADSRVGPHYCPEDGTIYLDETFFDELKKLGGQGDVAQAYVIAHEVGHNAQNQLGILDAEKTNTDSIKVELQADCFAGLWAYSIKGLDVFEPGEIAEAMDAAAAVGDDRIQAKYQGAVTPETWTHGSSQERVDSFNKGFSTGMFSSCLNK